MRYLLVALMILVVSSFAADKVATGSTGNPDAGTKGAYTVVDSTTPSTSSYYGLAIKDNATDSIWVSSWGDGEVYEYSTADLSDTGNSWTFGAAFCDMDGMGWINFATDPQWIGGGYTATPFACMFEEDGTEIRQISPPGTWDRVMGAAGSGVYNMVYISAGDDLAFGSYTGTETTISWTEETTASAYGLAVWDGGPVDALFVFLGLEGEDNVFIYGLDGSGIPDLTTPLWSCEFDEEATDSGGSIDFDGEYMYIMPQNGDLYKCSIDWTGVGIEAASLGEIKATFK